MDKPNKIDRDNLYVPNETLFILKRYINMLKFSY
jgi:hypothetical protein